MVMLISRFHRLIQSRLLWGSILVIVIFTFVIWGTQMPATSKKNKEQTAAGKLNGDFISQDEFRKAFFNTYMSIALSIGRPFDITGKLNDEIREAAWRRLAALREGAKMGLTGTDEEVMATIQHHPGFNDEGRFNQNRFMAFLQNVLAPMGFSEAQFEEHLRQEIVLQKLQNMIQQTVLVAPYDINRTFRSLSDKFDVEYVALTVTNFEKDVKVSRADAYSYFMAKPAVFTIPEKVRIEYIQVPASNYLASAVVTNEDDALGYYDEHINDYAVTNPVTLMVTNMLKTGSNVVVKVKTNEVTTLSFDEVKTNILRILTWQAARDRAGDLATDFMVSLAPDREGNALSFQDAAKKYKLQVKKAGPFALHEPVPGIDAGPTFNQTAFSLTTSPEEYFSDVILGSNFVYIIGLEEHIAARVPDFNEVTNEVMEAAFRNALSETLTKKAQEIREAAMKAVGKGDSFSKVMTNFKLKTVKTGEFTATSFPVTNEYSEVILRGVLSCNAGEVTDLLPLEEETILIVHLLKRAPGDITELDSIRPQIEVSVKRQRARLLFEGWEESILTQGGFEDRSKPTETLEEEEAAAEAAEAGETNAAPEENTGTSVPNQGPGPDDL